MLWFCGPYPTAASSLEKYYTLLLAAERAGSNDVGHGDFAEQVV